MQWAGWQVSLFFSRLPESSVPLRFVPWGQEASLKRERRRGECDPPVAAKEDLLAEARVQNRTT